VVVVSPVDDTEESTDFCPPEIERARVVGVIRESEEVLVDLIDLGTRCTVPFKCLTLLFQIFHLPPRAITLKMKDIWLIQHFPICQKFLTPASGIWQGKLFAVKTEKDEEDWTFFSAVITPQARPSGINAFMVERVMEELRQNAGKRIRMTAPNGEVCLIELPEASIPFGPISKVWSQEELSGFTKDHFIPFRILEVEENKAIATIRPDCFTSTIESLERVLMEDFTGWKPLVEEREGVEPLVQCRVAYMVFSAGKVHRAMAVKSCRSEPQGDTMCPMFLVDHAKVETVKMTNIKLLPKRFQHFIYSALVAHLVPVAVRSNGVTLKPRCRVTPWVNGESVLATVGALNQVEIQKKKDLSVTIGPLSVQLFVKDATPRRR